MEVFVLPETHNTGVHFLNLDPTDFSDNLCSLLPPCHD